MSVLDSLLTGGVFGFLGKAIDKIFPDPEDKAKAQAALMKAQVDGSIDTLNAELQVMVAEAKSEDKFTSRARPGFLYVVYIIILSAIPMGVLYAISPETAGNVSTGFRLWLAAIPEAMWALFATGYLGYAASRSYDKNKILSSVGSLKSR